MHYLAGFSYIKNRATISAFGFAAMSECLRVLYKAIQAGQASDRSRSPVYVAMNRLGNGMACSVWDALCTCSIHTPV
jgi:hypothetical protein